MGGPMGTGVMPQEQYQDYPPHGGESQFHAGAEMNTGMDMGMGTMGDTQMRGSMMKIDEETGRAPRRCTDLACCTIFIITAVVLLTINFSVRGHGNAQRLSHGTDYYGRICGVDQGVENMPFLYWCRADTPVNGVWSRTPSAIDLEYPSCVVACPKSRNSPPIACLLPSVPSAPVTIDTKQFNNDMTVQVTMTESIVLTAPYPTEMRGGRFCVPKDDTLRERVMTDDKALGPKGRLHWNVIVGTLHHLYFWLFLASLLACVLSMGYYACMQHCPKAIATIFLIPIALCFVFATVWSFMAIGVLIDGNSGFAKWYHERNPVYRQLEKKGGSILLIFLSIIFGLISCSLFTMWSTFVHAQNRLADLLNAARQCIRSVPCMYAPPWIEAFFKYYFFYLMLEGIRFIFSCGWMDKSRIHINGVRFAGLSRVFHYWSNGGLWTTWIWFYITLAVWICGMFWIIEICTAMGQFLVSYQVVQWYYIPKDPKFYEKKERPPCCWHKGVSDAFFYHFGSLCRGAAKIPWTRINRWGYWFLNELMPDSQTKGCCYYVKTFITCGGCFGLKDAFEKKVKEADPEKAMACKDAYTDIVIRSNDFEPANVKACELLQHSHKVVQLLYRDTYSTTASVMGVISISAACAFFVWIFVSELDRYKEEGSMYYVPDPNFVAFLAAILAGHVSYGFMVVWEQTETALMFCYTWNRINNRKSVDRFIPESLRAIVGWDDTENDRYPYYGKAKNNMYLRYWIPATGPKKAQDKMKEKKLATDMPSPEHRMGGPGMGPTPQHSVTSGRPAPGPNPGSYYGSDGNRPYSQDVYPGEYPQGAENFPLMAAQH